MSEPTSSPAAVPDYRAARRWNIVWVVPIVALLIGGWMIYRNLSSQGPVARVRFDTADGIAAGKTEVRCRSVRVGVVKNVKLADDLKSVLIYLELGPDSGGLLRRGTRFWVVRPRVSTTDISGLGTLLTGAYIELDPGPPDAGPWKLFKGRETPPATSRSIPGRRLVLEAGEAGSLVAGSPIYFRGFEVGRIESRKLEEGGARVVYDAFIREEYGSLVKENTRFWNTSGIDISAGADGFKVRTPSFQAMVSGGATFGVPDGVEAGPLAADGMTFTLFTDEDAAKDAGFNPTMKFLLLFNQSVRGLSRGAPVEFRGITIGRVADISLDYLKDAADSRVPVLIEIDPSLLRRESEAKMLDPQSDFLALSVKRGLRATLKTGNILTGALFVDFDYYPDALPAQLAKVGELATFPTVSSGFAQLEAKVTAILDKIGNAADEAATTVADARTSLKEIEATAASARATLDDPQFRELPSDLRATLAQLEKSVTSVGPEGAIQGDLLRTLDELRAALRAMKAMTTAIDEKPNSLIFGRESSGNPIPKAPSGKR
ncbi:MAG: intermembrane transport protein PqiB [Akkermansiaceae bacterium]